jgi:sortase A
MGRKIINLVTALLILAGAGLLLYPTVSNYWNSLRQTSAIADYTKAVEQLDSVDEEAILEEARAYNQSLMEDKNRWTLTHEEYETYSNTLDPFGTGMMGYLTIPKIQVSLPIYHGTSQSVLQAGAGHLPGSSLPVGGVGTHTVLSGHRGLPSSRLFTDLDELEEGDYFEIQVLTEKLTYEVE